MKAEGRKASLRKGKAYSLRESEVVAALHIPEFTVCLTVLLQYPGGTVRRMNREVQPPRYPH